MRHLHQGARHAPFLSLLQAAAGVAKELVLLTKHLARTKLTQTCRNTRVLLDVDGQVEEGLVAGCDGFASEAPRFGREDPLK